MAYSRVRIVLFVPVLPKSGGCGKNEDAFCASKTASNIMQYGIEISEKIIPHPLCGSDDDCSRWCLGDIF